MTTNLFFALLELCFALYFFYRIIFKKERKVGTGIAVGAFLVISLVHLTPFFSKTLAKMMM